LVVSDNLREINLLLHYGVAGFAGTSYSFCSLQAVYKAMTSILNKLTPQKFKTLLDQVLKLEINTEERLVGCIDIVFEKAIDEPNFSVAYANMAKYMTCVSEKFVFVTLRS